MYQNFRAVPLANPQWTVYRYGPVSLDSYSLEIRDRTTRIVVYGYAPVPVDTSKRKSNENIGKQGTRIVIGKKEI